MNVPLLDLKPQYETIKDEITHSLEELYATQNFILGPHVEALEQAVAAYCGCGYACAVSSGSDALIIALMAEGIGPGDEVITSSYTFFATAGAISRVGATPVFVDIDPKSYNMDVSAIEAHVTSRTKAVIPVHLYGQAADMDPILEVASRYGLVVIEDAAQAIGTEYKGRRVCSMGDYGCLSFFPSKNLGTFGDAGMVLSNNAEKIERIKILRNHGMSPQYHHQVIGGNFRMDALHAVILKIKLRHLDTWIEGRQRNAADYGRLLAGVEGLVLPSEMPYTTRHTYTQYVVRVQETRRQTVWDGLRKAGVGCAVYYPVPLHLQECYRSLGYSAGDLPVSESAAASTLALPIYPELTLEQKQYVAETLKGLLA